MFDSLTFGEALTLLDKLANGYKIMGNRVTASEVRARTAKTAGEQWDEFLKRQELTEIRIEFQALGFDLMDRAS